MGFFVNSLSLLLLGLFGRTLTFGNSSLFVSYIDRLNGWWDTAVLEAWGVPGYVSEPYSYNVLILAFYLSSGSAVDALDPWVNPTGYFSIQTMQTICNCSNPTDASFRQGLMNIYHAHGIRVIMTCFGSTDYPTQSTNPIALGTNIANFVKQYQLDGVDIDWEDTSAFSSGSGLGETWLSNLTSTIRSQLPSSDGYIITHAPQAPYFGGRNLYPQGGYLAVQQNVGRDIDWYNVQFYNQASSDYSTFATLFQSADGWAPNTAVYQMINGNNDMNVKIPADMIVVGKPCTTGDVDNTGYVAPSTMESIFSQAVSNQNVHWNTGFMTWQFASDLDQNFAFANTAAKAF